MEIILHALTRNKGIIMAKTPSQRVLTKKHLARLQKEEIQRKYILGIAIAVLVLVVGLITYGLLDQTVFSQLKPVAKVGAQNITVSEFQARVRFQRYQLVEQYKQTIQLLNVFGTDSMFATSLNQSITQIQSQLSDSTTLGSTSLDQLIEDAIIEQEAKTLNITVSDEEINKTLQEAFNFFPDGTPTTAPTATSFATPTYTDQQKTWLPPTATAAPTETLAATEIPLPTETQIPPTTTVDPSLPTATAAPTLTPGPTATAYTVEGYQTELKKLLDNVKDLKLNEAFLRSLIRSQLLRQKIFDYINADVKPEEEMVWARHILVADEATAKIVIEKLNAGGDFAALAKEYSTDGSKDSGGDLGWFGKGMMVAEFEQAAFALKVGEISQPVKSKFGFHIIQALGHETRALDSSAFDALKNKNFTTWMDEKKAADTVQKFDRWQTVIPEDPTIPVQ
jgi:parvulin-like peptidyl-prolyl isomerase